MTIQISEEARVLLENYEIRLSHVERKDEDIVKIKTLVERKIFKIKTLIQN
jgi:hypothetical protein